MASCLFASRWASTAFRRSTEGHSFAEFLPQSFQVAGEDLAGFVDASSRAPKGTVQEPSADHGHRPPAVVLAHDVPADAGRRPQVLPVPDPGYCCRRRCEPPRGFDCATRPSLSPRRHAGWTATQVAYLFVGLDLESVSPRRRPLQAGRRWQFRSQTGSRRIDTGVWIACRDRLSSYTIALDRVPFVQDLS